MLGMYLFREHHTRLARVVMSMSLVLLLMAIATKTCCVPMWLEAPQSAHSCCDKPCAPISNAPNGQRPQCGTQQFDLKSIEPVYFQLDSQLLSIVSPIEIPASDTLK